MKKVLMLLLAVSAFTLSCTNTELYGYGEGEPARITYMPVNRKATKAIINSGAFPTAETFHSVAWTSKQDWSDTAVLSDDKFIDDEIFYDNENRIWVSEKEYYWPLDYKVNFFAYYPDTLESGEFFINKGVLCLKDFVVPPTMDIDVLVADALLNASVDNNDYSDGVPTIFRHKLSKVQFRARLAENYREIAEFDKIVINSISLYSINNKGDWSFNSTENNTFGEWTNQSGATTGSKPDFTVDNVSSENGQGTVVTSVTPVTVGNEMVVMPQQMNADSKIVVDYTVYYSNNYSYSETSTIDMIEEFGTYDSAAGKMEYAWNINKYYIYTFKFDLTDDAISWAPEVIDWDQEEISGPVVSDWDTDNNYVNY